MTAGGVAIDPGVPRSADLRLAVVAAAAWAMVWWGFRASASAFAAIQVLLAIVACVVGARELWQHRRGARGSAIARATCAVAVGVIAVASPLQARMHAVHSGELAGLAGRHAHLGVIATVRDDPRALRPTGLTGAPRVAVLLNVSSVVSDGRQRSIRAEALVLAPSGGWGGLLPGQRVSFPATASLPRTPGMLSAVFTTSDGPTLIGRPPWWQRAAGSVRDGLQRACSGLPPLPGGLLPGMIDGDTSRMDPVLAQRFKVAGLTHLVAVSGTNCSILVGAVALLLRRMRASPATIAVLSASVLLAFVILARPSPSVLRAAVMAGIALAALATGRQRQGLPVLSATVLILLLWRPALAIDVGFALSVSATAALMLIAPRWAAALAARRVPPLIAEAVAVAAAAHLVTAPLIAAIGGGFSVVAIPANVLAEPAVAIAMLLGCAAAAVSVPLPALAAILAQLAGWPCRWLVFIAERFGTVDGGTLPAPSGMGGAVLLSLSAVVLYGLVRWPASRRPVALGLVVALLVQIPGRAVLVRWPVLGWLVVACDIGQGDAIVLAAGRGEAVVIDTGPEPVPVDRCLRELGVRQVPLLVLTHFHADHVAGLAGVLRGRRIGTVLVSPEDQPAFGSSSVARELQAHGLAARSPQVGDVFVAGTGSNAVRLSVIAPRHVFHGTHSDPNNGSIVLAAVTHGRRVLLTGDAEIEDQQEILASGADLRADILKVPHHGSAFSDERFLAAVHAQVALISVGRGNVYGHPAASLIDKLHALGVRTARTDELGDVAVALDHGRLIVEARHSDQK